MKRHYDITAAVATAANFVTETVVAVIPPYNYGLQVPPNVTPAQAWAPCSISGVLNITEGTTGTGFVLRVRQKNAGDVVGTQSPTGTQLGNADTCTLAAAAPSNFPFSKNDPNGSFLGYVVTITPVAATAATTMNSAGLDIEDY